MRRASRAAISAMGVVGMAVSVPQVLCDATKKLCSVLFDRPDVDVVNYVCLHRNQEQPGDRR